MQNIIFRDATVADLPDIVRMLADDFLGAQREEYIDPLPESYIRAFAEIDADRNNRLLVAEMDGRVVATLQLTLTPSISFRGGKRATVESVRVDERLRGHGVGRELMLRAIAIAKEMGVHLDATHNERRTHRCSPLLRAAWIQGFACRDETLA